jgi:hypothetical protein
MTCSVDDNPSIGLILCKGKSGIAAEYALRDIGKPLAIAEFRHLENLPSSSRGTIPTSEEIKAELAEQEPPDE